MIFDDRLRFSFYIFYFVFHLCGEKIEMIANLKGKRSLRRNALIVIAAKLLYEKVIRKATKNKQQ